MTKKNGFIFPSKHEHQTRIWRAIMLFDERILQTLKLGSNRKFTISKYAQYKEENKKNYYYYDK